MNRRMLVLVEVLLGVILHVKYSFSQTPIIGYDEVSWGASIETVRQHYPKITDLQFNIIDDGRRVFEENVNIGGKGNITSLKVDAIVTTANSGLLGGGGVDGAIHRAGGSQILEECKAIREKQGKLPAGGAVITSAGNLPAKYVIHNVGPVWEGGAHDESVKLANCYLNSLQLAIDNDCKTVAFPNISIGVFSYPKQEAAKIALKTVTDFLSEYREIEKVVFCCFDEENYGIFLG